MIIKTKRLILRPVTLEDAADIFEYCKSPDVGPNAGWKPHETLDETKEYIESVFAPCEDVFGITLQNETKVIGTLGLIEDPKRDNPNSRMLGYSLSTAYWGQGIMTEAVQALIHYGFDTKHFCVISAYCYPQNLRSKHVIEKCGFVYEGCLTQAEVLYDGKVEDNECYALTAEKFRAAT